MSIAASNVAPAWHLRRSLTPDDLRRLDEPAVIFEHQHIDSDGERAWCYTVAGWLDGVNVATRQGGCTVGGEVIVIHAETREQADDIACRGLGDTIEALDKEQERYFAAVVALASLESIGGARRMELATKPEAEKSPEFEHDLAKVRTLVGDDIILTAGLH